MNTIVRETTEMLTLLPETEQNLAYEIIKRMVLAWDTDFSKLTPAEQKELDEVHANPDYVGMDDIDWG